jgi:2-oxoglutarate-Fe(II)-dependent oxygenase superfamily protein
MVSGQYGVPHWVVSPAPGPLFDVDVPNGFQYRNDFITSDVEALLADQIARLEFSTFEMRGVVARRRVAFFGRSYDTGGGVTSPLPAFLMPLRDKIAVWASMDADAFVMALVNEYPPGAPIGWHRDAPQYDIVAGISLLSSCRMKFRPYARPAAHGSTQGRRRTASHEVTLEPRSAYLMAGESRNAYEHHIPAVTTLRYSITFRTVRS